MRSNRLYFFLLFLSALLCGCKDDDATTTVGGYPDYFILEENLFGCNDYETFNLSNQPEIYGMLKFGDYFIYDLGDELVVRQGIDGEVKIEEDIVVKKMLQVGNIVLLCTEDGVYEIDEDLNFTQRLDLFCLDLAFGPNDELLMSNNTDNNMGLSSNVIYEINMTDFSLSPATEPYPSSMCVSLRDLHVGNDGSIWAVTCAGTIATFADGLFTGMLNRETVPDWFSDADPSSIYLENYGGDRIVVLRNGVMRYRILRYNSAGEWNQLVNFTFTAEESDKKKHLTRGSLFGTTVRGDFLYVYATNGLQRYDLSTNAPLGEDDFEVFSDPALPSDFVNYIYDPSGSELFFITSQRDVTRVNCP